MTFKKSVCCGFRLINDNIISVCKHVMLCFVTTSRTEKGCGKWHFFGSEILSGFGEPGGGTPLPRIPFIPFMPFIPQNYNNSIYNNASAHPFFISFLKFIFWISKYWSQLWRTFATSRIWRENFFSIPRVTTVAIESNYKMTKNIYAPHSNILWTLDGSLRHGNLLGEFRTRLRR